MNRPTILLATAALATSALASDRNSYPQVFVQSAETGFITPRVGELASAEVGETLYSQGIRTVTKRFRVILRTDVATPINDKYSFVAKAGQDSPLLKRPGSSTPMICMPVKAPGFLGIGTKVVNGCLADLAGKGEFDHGSFAHTRAVFPLKTAVPYDVETLESTSEGQERFHVDVLYQGMSKGEVKISYREFNNGMARPAFNQDVSYELAPDGTAVIGFKGMRIRIVKATGQSIQYVVEQTMPRRSLDGELGT